MHMKLSTYKPEIQLFARDASFLRFNFEQHFVYMANVFNALCLAHSS